MAYYHAEDGTLMLDRPAAEDLACLMLAAAQALALEGGGGGGLDVHWLLIDKLRVAAAALMPF